MGRRIALSIVATLVTAGCLTIEQQTHTLYLDPDGAVTWTILETGIRSTANSREDRSRQEQAFLDSIADDTHATATALRALHPAWIGSRLTRDERPYSLETSARFAGIDRVYEELFTQVGVRAEVTLARGAEATRLEIIARADEGAQAGGGEESELVLLELLEGCTLQLTAGRFVDAVGFTISDDGTVARPQSIAPDDLEKEVVLSLAWVVEE